MIEPPEPVRDAPPAACDRGSATRRATGFYLGLVGALNAAGWGLLILWVAPAHPRLLGLGVLAFTFGLRHAFDADHISAIDNTVRKLLQSGRRKPVGAGFHFSLGHSTVVALLVLAFALTTEAVRSHLPALQQVGDVVGTVVSGVFLYVIGLLNLAVLLGVVAVFRGMRGGRYDQEEVERQLLRRGLMTRLLGSRWDMVRREWHMYPIGFLFGLGFDTASEVALLAISATAAAQRLPIASVMVLPLLFAAGMSLMDTGDGVFMATAYAWAFSNPARKVYYNLTVTALSVFVALAVGTVELMHVAVGELHLRGPLWSGLAGLSFESLGIGIVGLFVFTWAASYLIWIWRVERRWRGVPG